MNVVDVLAVLADYSAQHGDPEDFTNARAAVAELIEAHKKLLDYVLSEAEARNYDPPADTAVIADSEAALARVQGGAK